MKNKLQEKIYIELVKETLLHEGWKEKLKQWMLPLVAVGAMVGPMGAVMHRSNIANKMSRHGGNAALIAQNDIVSEYSVLRFLGLPDRLDFSYSSVEQIADAIREKGVQEVSRFISSLPQERQEELRRSFMGFATTSESMDNQENAQLFTELANSI
jgi:hypothetical protein